MHCNLTITTRKGRKRKDKTRVRWKCHSLEDHSLVSNVATKLSSRSKAFEEKSSTLKDVEDERT